MGHMKMTKLELREAITLLREIEAMLQRRPLDEFLQAIQVKFARLTELMKLL